MSINFNANFNTSFNQRLNPDEYAKQYAEQNNISLEDAKTQLESQYGVPTQQESSSVFNLPTMNSYALSTDTFTPSSGTNGAENNSAMGFAPMEQGNFQFGNIFQQIMGIFKQPQGQASGQMPNQAPGQASGQVPGQAPGQAAGQMPNQVPGQAQEQAPNQQNTMVPSVGGNKQDPNEYAQAYADANGISLEEAIAELKEKYGEPQQM